jgi:hypothetical protein
MDCAAFVMSKNSLPNSMPKLLLPMSYYRGFIILGLTVIFMIHVNFVYEVTYGAKFIGFPPLAFVTLVLQLFLKSSNLSFPTSFFVQNCFNSFRFFA